MKYWSTFSYACFMESLKEDKRRGKYYKAVSRSFNLSSTTCNILPPLKPNEQSQIDDVPHKPSGTIETHLNSDSVKKPTHDIPLEAIAFFSSTIPVSSHCFRRQFLRENTTDPIRVSKLMPVIFYEK